ncbi:hypothetical protein LJY25_18935 [Hymenobacter sp. BT175]|uniref:hypothetical protein n=1 Tax=Hymenobacter translucens TaxID=2886507 RepID=UPI001D0EA89E|nr:hypothetical protein [Hymenobacter translucens]MCC2548531.1 hypothetical protein [Hymenobacter translucens]
MNDKEKEEKDEKALVTSPTPAPQPAELKQDKPEPSAPVRKKYNFFIEKKKYETDQPTLTVRQILVDFAQVDPTAKTLAQKQDGGFRELKNLEEVIELHSAQHFALFDDTSTPVS